MYRLLVIICFSFFISGISSAQNSLNSLITHYFNMFTNSNKILIVKGRLTDKYPDKLNNIFESWGKENFEIKYEDELDSLDRKKHLQFYGPIGSYKNLQAFLPGALTLTEKGFDFGPYHFTDSLDAISIISSESDRYFQISNSYTGLKTLWTTFQELSQYFIMQNQAITHHGFLSDNKFDPAKHYDVWKLRREQLLEKTTKYYAFYYDPEVFTRGQNADSIFFNEDKKIDTVLNFLELDKPERKIECFLYKDFAQKYYLSATPGDGNTFNKVYQNHSIGFGAAEHESIHILFNNQAGTYSTFFSEGIVGYYYSYRDSSSWRRTRLLISNKKDFKIKKYLVNSRFDFAQEDYAAAAFFVRYLIDSYGLKYYKSFLKAGSILNGFTEIYGKTIDEICEDWERYFNKNKLLYGPERRVTIKVITNNLPDSSKIFITGDNKLLGNWNPGKIELVKQTNGNWLKEFSFPEGSIINYKITRGSWENEALNENGSIPGNSVIEVKQDDTLLVNINKWKDQIKK